MDQLLSPPQPVVIADGANYLVIDGSVVWNDLTGDVYYYGRDYGEYHKFVVGPPLKSP